MTLQTQFPWTSFVFRVLTGRWARRSYLAIFLILASLTTIARVRTLLLTGKFHQVLTGLEHLQIDQTTEAELVKTVPYLTREQPEKDADGKEEVYYAAVITNESDWLMSHLFFRFYGNERLWQVSNFLGYRYVSFSAGIVVRDGTVSSIRYAAAGNLVYPSMAGTLLSVKSVHGFWMPYQSPIYVTKSADESPQLQVKSFKIDRDEHVSVTWASDAPRDLVAHTYQIDLGCFWGLRACRSGFQLAPRLQDDQRRIEIAVRERLKGSRESCPDEMLARRIRYFLDTDVMLLEVSRSQIIEEKGELVTVDPKYKLIDVIRGNSARYRERFALGFDPAGPFRFYEENPFYSNSLLIFQKEGDRVLFFTNDNFDSCRVVPATPSAIAAVRAAVQAPRRLEDENWTGFM